MLIRRFGPGVRRASNPEHPGTEEVAFWRDDERGVLLSEVYLPAGAGIPAQANPNHCVFRVIEVEALGGRAQPPALQAGEADLKRAPAPG